MEKNFNAKKTVNIVVNVILWIFVAFCVFVTVIAVSASTNAKNVPTIGGKCILNVLSDSMDAAKPDGVSADKPSGFARGNVIIGNYIATDDNALDALEVGDVITFEKDLNGDGVMEYNTHRILAIERGEDGALISVTTKGDNNGTPDADPVRRSAIIARYTGTRIPVLGSVLAFLNTQLGFGLCILLPLFLFFVYQLIVFIRALMAVKNSGKKMISAADEELIKQKAIEEYLRRQQENTAASDASSQAKVPSAETGEQDAPQSK